MRLDQAIEKAGPGGRIRTAEMMEGRYYTIKGETLFYHDNGLPMRIEVSDITRTDWEVVQDEVIEVGDVVQGPCDKEGEVLGVECEVLKHGKILTRLGLLGENSICCCKKYLTKDLTLIRKGPKKQYVACVVDDDNGVVWTTGLLKKGRYEGELTEVVE
jgi:hypothetical protein